MSVLRGQIHIRISNIAPGRTALRFTGDAANGPVAGNFYANAFFILHCRSQKKRAGYRPSQRGSRQMGQIMTQRHFPYQPRGTGHINPGIPNRSPCQYISFAGKIPFGKFILYLICNTVFYFVHVNSLLTYNFLNRFAISMALIAASYPLLPALVPARSTACWMFSVVKTPNATGTPVFMEACATPLAASAQT